MDASILGLPSQAVLFPCLAIMKSVSMVMETKTGADRWTTLEPQGKRHLK